MRKFLFFIKKYIETTLND